MGLPQLVVNYDRCNTMDEEQFMLAMRDLYVEKIKADVAVSYLSSERKEALLTRILNVCNTLYNQCKGGHPADRQGNGSSCPERSRLFRQMLHFRIRLLRGCPRRRRSCGGSIPASERQGYYQQHWHHHRLVFLPINAILSPCLMPSWRYTSCIKAMRRANSK